MANLPTCRDTDDVFVDAPCQRVYVSCGEGVIYIFAKVSNGYERIARGPYSRGRSHVTLRGRDRPAVCRRVGDRS
jgi:hypothetical protein